MYIKEIKANGFKSFVDKTNLNLDKTFTGIVGPNGSGKSNIVDAVKWVLGEQSVKNLRGSQSMTDVIFAGSKTRNPSSSASVTIVFDNSDKHLPVDYEEVSIKRTVYKSGENEYFLNGNKCRLKDITDLFVDSFSSKESFNIISQGKVSEILSNKAEDRRAILEEAAGVLKYKNRKKESLRKLERTDENISKIDMIIAELNENIAPLEEQSKKAKIYKEAASKLESIEVALLSQLITDNNLKFKNNETRINEINETLIKEDKNTSKEDTKLEKLKLDEIKLDEKINNIQKDIISSTERLNKLNSEKELTRERSKYNTDDVKVKNNLIDIKERKLKLESNKKILNKELDSLKEELIKIEDSLKDSTNEYNTLESKRKVLNEELNEINKKNYSLKYKIETLNESINNGSKIPYAVKSVLDNPRLNGINNIVGNIVETEEKYSTMLEIALASSVNFVITENEESAKKAIDYLKQNKLGRVTFYPKNVIKPKSVLPEILDEIKTEKGFINLASELVTYDKEYYNIVTNILGNIIVVDTINNGINISKKINYKYRVVSLDGELIHVGGSLTGGSKNSKVSLIGEKFELSRLNSLLLYNEKDKINKENSLKELDYDLEILKENIYKKTSLKVKTSEELNSKKITIESTLEELDKINTEYDNLTKNSSELIEKELDKIMNEFYKEQTLKKELETSLNNYINKRKDTNESISDLEENIKKQNKEYNKLNNELKSLEIENAKLSMALDNDLASLNENYNLTYEMSKEKTLDISVDEAKETVSKLKLEIKSLGDVNLGSIEEYERVSKRFNFLNSQREDLKNSEENLLGIINEMDEVMETKFMETFDKVNVEFKHVFNKLFGGGEAKLELTDPDNILTTGVDIKATPPGKKLTNISLLSGGEKTLTAISLLFAIMNLNDVPFAILDEVEAALDEANVERFGSYLDNYKGKTQLLIITHKKKTMEYVDLLYGVTMQESGVSKLVSVRLENVE